MNTNIWGDFQICISVPLNESKTRLTLFHESLNRDNLPLQLSNLKINELKISEYEIKKSL